MIEKNEAIDIRDTFRVVGVIYLYRMRWMFTWWKACLGETAWEEGVLSLQKAIHA